MPLLSPPPTVLEIAAALERLGYETWCVGGAVRDALLGHAHLDWDLATAATPDRVREIFGHKRTIPVGIDFGTVGVLDRGGTLHEVTTFRRDVHTDGRHAVVEFGVSLDEDLARRDFTINAIAYSPSRDELRDPFGGAADLERRVVRAVGDPDQRMAEDRLRALRALRFAARFDFTIDPSTLRAIAASAPHLSRLSAERVKQEIDKTMEQARCPSRAFTLWRSTGAFATLIDPLAGVDDRTLVVPDWLAQPGLSRRPQRRINRIAGLLSSLPTAEAVRVMTSLRASKEEIRWVSTVTERCKLVREQLVEVFSGARRPNDGQIRRLVATIGRLHVGAVMRLARAEYIAAHGPAAAADPSVTKAVYRRMLRAAFYGPVDVRDLAIDGGDLQREGIPPGPGMGKILHTLLDSVLDDPGHNRTDWLLQEAARLHRLS
jgi:tRNA nucleotidyltransferase (CCA-adding enzyme)